jgi:hypothetical protein
MMGKPEVIPADPIRAITSGWPTIQQLSHCDRNPETAGLGALGHADQSGRLSSFS